MLIQLFLSFLYVGMFNIGGGYAAMKLISNQVVDIHHWLSMEEFSDVVTISEMTPGPIVVNSATFVGQRVAGFAGAIVATAGSILPAFFIVSFMFYLYCRYKKLNIVTDVLSFLRPMVVALIASAAFSLLTVVIGSAESINYIGIVLFVCAFIALRKTKLTPIAVMVMCGAVSLIIRVVFNV